MATIKQIQTAVEQARIRTRDYTLGADYDGDSKTFKIVRTAHPAVGTFAERRDAMTQEALTGPLSSDEAVAFLDLIGNGR